MNKNRFAQAFVALLLAGTMASAQSKANDSLSLGEMDLRINGHININDRVAGDQAWAALAITRGGAPAAGLRVTLNGAVLSEAAGTYNYQGLAPGFDAAIGSEMRIEVLATGALVPPSRAAAPWVAFVAALPGVIRFDKPEFSAPAASLLGEGITFSWKFLGDIGSPVDVQVYEKPGGKLVFEQRAWGRTSIQVGWTMLPAGTAYSFHLLKPLGDFPVTGAHVVSGSAIGLRYIAEQDIAPRLR